MDLKAFQIALDQLEAERSISKEQILATIEMALAAAYKKDYGKKGQIIKVKLDFQTGKTDFYQVKIVVSEDDLKPDSLPHVALEKSVKTPDGKKKEKASAREKEIVKEIVVEKKEKDDEDEYEDREEGEDEKIRFNPERHILISEAKKIKKNAEPEDEIIFPLEPKSDYGRIAAQTAKQVILQNIKEAEKETLFNEFKNREGEIITGIIQRAEMNNVFLDLGKTTAVLPKEEQVREERYRLGERIKALILSVQKTQRGLSIVLSRTHPRFVLKLFEMEVPEILNGSVVVKGIAREPGSRSKIAVASIKDGIDPVGSCVGQKGVRVNTVINELGGEKLDIIEWSENEEIFIKNSLAPAKILDTEADNEKREVKIIVDESELSLAIGRNGQNVRLAAKLTGYKIDINSKEGESVIQANEEGEIMKGTEDNESLEEGNLENN